MCAFYEIAVGLLLASPMPLPVPLFRALGLGAKALGLGPDDEVRKLPCLRL